jgi:hypothetical protein
MLTNAMDVLMNYTWDDMQKEITKKKKQAKQEANKKSEEKSKY